MAERKIGDCTLWKNLSSVLAMFRLMPQDGSKFPGYKAGQYIALRREDCLLTKKVGVDEAGHAIYGPDLDEKGVQKRGQVTHSYSISSAPHETEQNGWLEFYVILEKGEHGEAGRLTGSLFRIHPPEDNKITYVDRITGDFTLDKRVGEKKSVVFVGTGTGLAPFAGMVKQLHHDAMEGKTTDTRYTLFHTNRVHEELGYHDELLKIQDEHLFDFVYVPTISRPAPRDLNDPQVGMGRATNVLRYIFDMPLREEEALAEVQKMGGDTAKFEDILYKTVRPVLPSTVSKKQLCDRLNPADTVILSCGNPHSMDDVKYIAEKNQIKFEKEDW